MGIRSAAHPTQPHATLANSQALASPPDGYAQRDPNPLHPMPLLNQGHPEPDGYAQRGHQVVAVAREHRVRLLLHNKHQVLGGAARQLVALACGEQERGAGGGANGWLGVRAAE